MTNKYKLIFFNFLNILSSCCITTSCGCQHANFLPEVIDKEIAYHNQNSWYDSMKEIANCNIPTIYIGCNASFQIQQQISMYFSIDQLSNKKNIYADQIMIIGQEAYKYKTQEIGTESLFKYNWKSLVEKDDILKDGIRNASHALITSMEDFDISTSEYKDKSNSVSIYSYDSYLKVIEKLFELYDQDSNSKMQFNFVISDLWVMNRFKEFGNINKIMSRLLNRAKKIYVVSDGAYSYSKGAGNYISEYIRLWKKYGYTSYKDQLDLWNRMHSTNDLNYVAKLYSQNPIALINNEQFYTFFNADGSFYNSKLNNIEQVLVPSVWSKYSMVDLNWQNYKEKLNLTNDQYNSLDTSMKNFFNFFDSKYTQKFCDYVVADTSKNYDENKKNIIFPLPSELAHKEIDNKILEGTKKVFAKISNNFPTDKYNYIYKMHPRCKEEDMISGIKSIFNNELPANTIILDNTYPLEYLILLDWSLKQNGTENVYHLIDPSSFLNDDYQEINGLLAGFSLTTSSIINTIMLISKYFVKENNKEIGIKNAIKLSTQHSFFIPNEFDISNCSTHGNFYKTNVSYIKNLYDQFYELGLFIDPNLFEKA